MIGSGATRQLKILTRVHIRNAGPPLGFSQYGWHNLVREGGFIFETFRHSPFLQKLTSDFCMVKIAMCSIGKWLIPFDHMLLGKFLGGLTAILLRSFVNVQKEYYCVFINKKDYLIYLSRTLKNMYLFHLGFCTGFHFLCTDFKSLKVFWHLSVLFLLRVLVNF